MPPLPRKGLLLAGGRGTRLLALTGGGNKHLLPIHDRAMVEYPLGLLLRAACRELLVVADPASLPALSAVLGDGRHAGAAITYAAQPRPEGVAQVFALAAAAGFLPPGQPCVLALGDNLFLGPDTDLDATLARAATRTGATVFPVRVPDASPYGVVTLDDTSRPLSLVEKPAQTSPGLAVPGLYFYDGDVLDHAARLRPSARGELEITDLNRAYLAAGRLHLEPLPPALTWIDAGTPDRVAAATRLAAACPAPWPEQIAWQRGWIDADRLRARIAELGDTPRAAQLRRLLTASA